jgi:hypothetical protein
MRTAAAGEQQVQTQAATAGIMLINGVQLEEASATNLVVGKILAKARTDI